MPLAEKTAFMAMSMGREDRGKWQKSQQKVEASVRGNESGPRTLKRRTLLTGIAATMGSAVTPGLATAAIQSGKGQFRTINLVNNRTGEWVNTVYWIEGQYVTEALDAINNLMRDWRLDQISPIDQRTIDIISATHNLLDCAEPFEIVSGYRSPQTNASLRKRSRGVARNSYHMRGMAADLKLTSRNVRQISGAARSLGAGGVGKYSRSQFVHVDSGPVRDWGR